MAETVRTLSGVSFKALIPPPPSTTSSPPQGPTFLTPSSHWRLASQLLNLVGGTPHSAHQPVSDTTANKIPLCFQQLEEKLKGQADYEEVKKELK